jgi:hypothetical protein
MKTSIALLSACVVAMAFACGCSSSDGVTPNCPNFVSDLDATDGALGDVCTSIYDPNAPFFDAGADSSAADTNSTADDAASDASSTD